MEAVILTTLVTALIAVAGYKLSREFLQQPALKPIRIDRDIRRKR